MANPEYPLRAMVNNIQGRVEVQVQIGADGKVIFAKATGPHPILEEAAENNVRQWEFGPFPPEARFPIYHIVIYDFELKGPPLSVIQMPTIVRTHLPDRVEIESRLFKDDYGLEPIPAPKGAKQPRGTK